MEAVTPARYPTTSHPGLVATLAGYPAHGAKALGDTVTTWAGYPAHAWPRLVSDILFTSLLWMISLYHGSTQMSMESRKVEQ